MPNEEVVGSAAVQGNTATESVAEQPTGETPDSTTPTDPVKTELTDPGKKSLKVPDALKPKGEAGGKNPGWIQQRLSHYAKERDELRARVAELEGKQTGKGNGKTQEAVGSPSPDQFDTYQEYVDALVDYKIELRNAEQTKQRSEQSAQAYQAEKRHEFEQHASAIVEQVPQFWDAITDPSLPVTDAMAEAVMELGELAPYTMLWLATNKGEAGKMARMHPRAATLAIGRLAVQLERDLQGGASDGAQPSQLNPATPQFQPKPVPTIRGGSPGNMDDSPNDKDNIKTWLAKEAARQAKKFGNRNMYGANGLTLS
jgi:hypothetical protein